MSPRIVESKRCPHCKAKLPEPTPRMCPECAGSLQKRFLSLGCFTTAPPLLLALAGAGWLARAPAPRADVVERAPADVRERPDAVVDAAADVEPAPR